MKIKNELLQIPQISFYAEIRIEFYTYWRSVFYSKRWPCVLITSKKKDTMDLCRFPVEILFQVLDCKQISVVHLWKTGDKRLQQKLSTTRLRIDMIDKNVFDTLPLPSILAKLNCMQRLRIRCENSLVQWDNRNTQIIAGLTPNLSSLEINYKSAEHFHSETDEEHGVKLVSLAKTFPKLKKLVLLGTMFHNFVTNATFPPLLQVLHVTLDSLIFGSEVERYDNVKWVESLPQTLQKLSLANYFFCGFDPISAAAKFLPKLLHLGVILPSLKPIKSLNGLPQTLTSIGRTKIATNERAALLALPYEEYLSVEAVKDFKYMPPLIESAGYLGTRSTIETMALIDSGILPKNLTALTFNVDDPNQLSHLPHHLQELSIMNAEFVIGFDLSLFKSLKRLRVYSLLDHFSPVRRVPQVDQEPTASSPYPISLRDLSNSCQDLRYLQVKSPQRLSSLTMSDNLLACSIDFCMSMAATISSEILHIDHISRSLLRLYLHTGTRISYSTLVNFLPRHLKDLDVTNMVFDEQVVPFSRLPPDLTTLVIWCAETVRLKSENFKLLPQSITHLELWHTISECNVLMHMPPKLQSLKLFIHEPSTEDYPFDLGYVALLPQSLVSFDISQQSIHNPHWQTRKFCKKFLKVLPKNCVDVKPSYFFQILASLNNERIKRFATHTLNKIKHTTEALQ